MCTRVADSTERGRELSIRKYRKTFIGLHVRGKYSHADRLLVSARNEYRRIKMVGVWENRGVYIIPTLRLDKLSTVRYIYYWRLDVSYGRTRVRQVGRRNFRQLFGFTRTAVWRMFESFSNI